MASVALRAAATAKAVALGMAERGKIWSKTNAGKWASILMEAGYEDSE